MIHYGLDVQIICYIRFDLVTSHTRSVYRRQNITHSKMSSKKDKAQKSLTKEEELLLQDFSRNVSTKSSALFYGNALIVSAIPIWLFWRIHQMDLYQSGILFAVGTLVSTYLVAFAYKNVKFVLKHKIAQKREDAVTREMTKKFSDDKKMTRKERDERILWKKNEVADYEATTFSIFYNNAFYLVLLILCSFYVLKNFSPMFNYLMSVGLAAGLLALFSTSNK